MRMFLQRVSSARVTVDGKVTGEIGPGLLLLLGIGSEDGEEQAEYLLDKILHLRIFQDTNGKMNCSLLETGGSLLIVSQFTLYADIRKGRRPSFDRAAPPEQARVLYDYFVNLARNRGVNVQTGIFQAVMSLESINSGPVSIFHDSNDKFKGQY